MATTVETFLVLAALLLLLQVAAAESAPSSQTCKQSSEAHGSRLVQLSQDLRRSSISSLVSETESTSSSSFNIGKAGCQCIGIDWPDGYQNLTLNGQKAIYPQSMGTSCEPWDYARHPDCKGSHSPSWCRKSWCFVDACHCDLNTLPKTSSYLPNTTFQGRKVYYSYATCGDTDEWTELNYFSSCVHQKTEADCAAVSKCAWTKSHGCLGKELAVAKGETCKHVEESVLGDDACKCIGLDVPHGSIKATIDSRTYEYPANTGAHCNSWDAETHPTCHGDNPPAWCQQKWCYVDPCSCNISVAPKKNTYVPGATSQGKPLFYSYMTCGQADSYSASLNKKACPNYGDTQSCSDQAQCAWTGSKCVLKELMGLCGAVQLPPLPIDGTTPALKDPQPDASSFPPEVPEDDSVSVDDEPGKVKLPPLPIKGTTPSPKNPPPPAAEVGQPVYSGAAPSSHRALLALAAAGLAATVAC